MVERKKGENMRHFLGVCEYWKTTGKSCNFHRYNESLKLPQLFKNSSFEKKGENMRHFWGVCEYWKMLKKMVLKTQRYNSVIKIKIL